MRNRARTHAVRLTNISHTAGETSSRSGGLRTGSPPFPTARSICFSEIPHQNKTSEEQNNEDREDKTQAPLNEIPYRIAKFP